MTIWKGSNGDDIYVAPALEANIIVALKGNDNITGGYLFDSIDGGEGNDTVHGLAGDDQIIGGVGNDLLFGDEGDDSISVGTGNNTVDGGRGDDILDLSGSAVRNVNVAVGGAGDDLIMAGSGADLIDGGAGEDTVSYAASKAWVRIDLAARVGEHGDADRDTYRMIENAVGSKFDDVMQGNTGANTFEGGAGNDALFGGEGDDYLSGGAGNDVMRGDAGGDELDGGKGRDLADYINAASGVYVNLGAPQAGQTDWAAKGDLLISIEDVEGAKLFANSLTGDANANALIGGDLADTLMGGDGADTLVGFGGGDQMQGGAGADVFDASGIYQDVGDVIFDFQHGIDKIDIPEILAFDQLSFEQIDYDKDGDVDDVAVSGDGSQLLILLNISASSFDSGDFI